MPRPDRVPPVRPRRRHRAHEPERGAHRAQRRLERRDELLDAALQVVRRDGPGASMDRLAAEAGVTKPILYRHFGDRNGLVRAVGTRFAEELRRELESALRSERGPRELLSATIDAYLSFVERDPQVYRFLVHRAAGDQYTAAALTEFVQQMSQEVAVVLGEELRRVGADSGGAEPWAYGIVGMVHAAGDWWVERRPMPRARLADYLVTLLWGGLAGLGLRGEDA
jgi:AcrR family transcriptional regulator